MKDCIKLMRVKHWIKNFLIFLPLFFNKQIFSMKLAYCAIAFIAFSLLASVIYINNDLKDIEEDKKHPTKKNRPLASGRVSKKTAVIMMIVLLLLSIGINIIGITSFNFDKASIVFLLIYLIINLGYSFGLKNIPIVDLIILAFGFIIRVLYGGLVCNIPISNWLFLTVLSMAFYLGLGKRRNELKKNSAKARKSLAKYNMEFLDKNMYMFLGMTLVFYCLWVVGITGFVGDSPIIYSTLIVFFIVMKYSLIIEGNSLGDPVEVVLNDKILMASIVVYVILMGVFLYIL